MKKTVYKHTCPICEYKWSSYVEKPLRCANCGILLAIAEEYILKHPVSLNQKVEQVEKNIAEFGQLKYSHGEKNNSPEPIKGQISVFEAIESASNTDEGGNLRMKPTSKLRQCPFCRKQIWTEYAQKHYSDSHEGAQI